MGVAGQIIPWNYPLAMAAWKLGPALAAGCTVVIKPAEQTPLSLLDLAEDFEAIGLPPAWSTSSPDSAPTPADPSWSIPTSGKIAFTGSAEVGKLIMRNAADQLKRVSLELGGKSPNIFFADADFEAAVDGALFGTFINQGEVCSAGSRVLVQKDIYKKFVEACAAKAKTIKLGPGHRAGDQDGPAGERGTARPRGEVPGDRSEGGEGRRGRRRARTNSTRAGTSSRPSSTTWTTAPRSRRKKSSDR